MRSNVNRLAPLDVSTTLRPARLRGLQSRRQLVWDVINGRLGPQFPGLDHSPRYFDAGSENSSPSYDVAADGLGGCVAGGAHDGPFAGAVTGGGVRQARTGQVAESVP